MVLNFVKIGFEPFEITHLRRLGRNAFLKLGVNPFQLDACLNMPCQIESRCCELCELSVNHA